MHLSADVLYSNLLADLGQVIDTSLPGWSIDSDVRSVQAYCLKASFLKKFNNEDRPSPDACLAALEKFEAVNDRCASWAPGWNFSWEEELINEIKRSIDQFWFVGGVSPLISDVRQCFADGRSGPGASLCARSEDMYTKMFDSPLSSTRTLPELWERCCSEGALWFEAEASRAYSHGTTVVDSSKYSFVNKTRTVARGICTEPTINMWFQLGVGKALERRLSSFYGIRLDLQPDKNRELARAGSVDGNCSTIDLESASDSLSLKMLEFMLPRSFLAVLKLFRCERTTLPTGRVLDLNMVSTMGNGYTFPLQTMLFSAVVHGVANYLRVRGSPPILKGDNFGVFGDDIICPSSITRTVIHALNLLGFTVNSEKSFVEGPFRESCGADFFAGVNVRGVYLKQLHSQQDLYVIINTLNRWSAKTGIFLPCTVGYLTGGLRKILYVPLDENDDAGLHTPLSYIPAHRQGRSKMGHRMYSVFRPQEYAFYILGGYVWTFREQVRRSYNPAGLYITLLFGGIRGERVLLRRKRPRYSTRRSSTPRWDWLPPRPFEGLVGPGGYRRLVDAWHWNLLGSSAFEGLTT